MAAQYAHPGYLAETVWLANHLSDPDLRIFDCTVEMSRKAIRSRVAVRHMKLAILQGAAFIDLMCEFKDPGHPLYLMMPPADRFVYLALQFGISDSDTVVR